MAKILVIDDELKLTNSLRAALEEEGYDVLIASDGEAGLKCAREASPDLIILDVMMPKINGLDVCRILRQESNVRILMLTAKDDVIDKVLGLELGADDYLTKPFSLRELMARIKAQFRRKELDSTINDGTLPSVLVKEDLQVDLISRRATCSGRVLPLKPKEFDLLALLMSFPGQVFSKGELLEKVWGYDASDYTRTVIVHIGGLRQKLRTCCPQLDLIETVRGAGYRFRG
ncbi:MAG: response regulator transcription factor [Chloroflexota bacterium]